MLILKLEQNLFLELDPANIKEQGINHVTTWVKEDSIFRSMPVDFFEGVEAMTVERRKYPFFYKYYLYLGNDLSNNVELRSEKGAKFILAFHQKFHPEFIKNPIYKEDIGMKPEEYFYMEKIPGGSMQHFVPGKGLVEELEPSKGEKEETPVMSTVLEGYHTFTAEEKNDIGGQLDALKSQFADQLKDLEALMGKKENGCNESND